MCFFACSPPNAERRRAEAAEIDAKKHRWLYYKLSEAIRPDIDVSERGCCTVEEATEVRRRANGRNDMKPGETKRYECPACLIEFEIILEPKAKGDPSAQNNLKSQEPDVCPFCGDDQIEEV